MTKAMKRVMFVVVAAVGAATTVPAQQPATGLQDLIGVKGRDGEYQLQQRGYRFIRTEKSGGDAYSYWQETENGQCVTVRTSNGRYASIVYAPAFDCRQSSGSAMTGSGEGSVRGLNDLVGVRASYGEDELRRRGYSYVSTQKDMDSSYTFWRENRTGRCVGVRTSDGRYQDIYYTSDSDCSGGQGYDSGGYGNQSYGGSSTGGGVTLYRDLNFGGTSEHFTSDVPDLRSSRIGNDQATSVRVDSGCTAQLFTDINYRGTSIELTADESDLRRSRIGNDNISSMRVRCGGGYGGGYHSSDEWGDHNASYGATLYRDINFGGISETFTSDDADLRNSRIGSDQATSVRVSPGCRARLYRDINFGGPYTEVVGDASDLRGSTVGNDTVTSIRVRCDR